MWSSRALVSALALAILIVVPTAAAALNGSPARSPALAVVSSDSWAFGTERWFNLTQATPMGTHTVQAWMSWYTINNRTNVSADVTAWTIERTVASSFSSTYCSPDCTTPTLKVDLNHTAYEHATGFVNMTRAAVVYENGTGVAAFGLLNASASADARLTSHATVWVTTAQGVRNVSESFAAYGSANASLAFTPALGLIPISLSAGVSWNATSAYVGGGDWSAVWNYTKTNASGSTITASGSPSGSLNVTGNLSVEGAVVATHVLPNGTVLPAISLEFSGDFGALDGLILLPHAFDFFGYGPRSWDGYRLGFAHMETTRLAIEFQGGSTSLRLRAATSDFGTNDSAMDRGEAMRGHSGPMSTVPLATATAAEGIPTTSVVAQPVGVVTAQEAQDCMAQTTCTTAASSPPGAFPSTIVLALAVGGAVVAAVALMVVWRRGHHRA